MPLSLVRTGSEAMAAPMPELFDGYPMSVLNRFWKFHTNNPHVYREFKKYSHEMRDTGRDLYSARTIIEVIRWHFDLKTSGDVFEINGDFVPIYVRLLIYDQPEFKPFFELRTVRSRGVKSDEQQRREVEDGAYGSA